MINERQREHLEKLSSTEIRDFFVLYVGLDCFVKKLELVKLNKPSFLKEIEYDSIQNEVLKETYNCRLKIIYNNQTFYLLFKSKNKEMCIYNKGVEIFFRSINDYTDELAEDVIDLLIDVCQNKIEEKGYRRLKSLFYLKRNNDFGYRFIVGSGINNGYGLPDWKKLEQNFELAADNFFGKRICKDISTTVFNNNYGSFQIVKDISYSEYKSILTSMINSAKEPHITDRSSLMSIASVLFAQSLCHSELHQQVLTFNYDDLLERALGNCFNEDVLTIYKNSKKRKSVMPNFSFSVIHSHGYIPKALNPVLKRHYDSIVLTTKEYFDNYKTPSSFGYRELYNQLDKVCSFVGNSFTDYEEQKVVSKHFSEHPSQFHFCYLALELEKTPIEAIMYKTIFLLKIGVIPLWYDTHDKYVEEFYEYAEKKCCQ